MYMYLQSPVFEAYNSTIVNPPRATHILFDLLKP